jgi:hypothetical protein
MLKRTYAKQMTVQRQEEAVGRDTTARRKQIVQQTRPWEKAPGYVQAQGDKTGHTTAAPASRVKKR